MLSFFIGKPAPYGICISDCGVCPGVNTGTGWTGTQPDGHDWSGFCFGIDGVNLLKWHLGHLAKAAWAPRPASFEEPLLVRSLGWQWPDTDPILAFWARNGFICRRSSTWNLPSTGSTLYWSFILNYSRLYYSFLSPIQYNVWYHILTLCFSL